jgi:hypothetical protein
MWVTTIRFISRHTKNGHAIPLELTELAYLDYALVSSEEKKRG